MASLLNISRVKYLIDENSEEIDSLANLYFCMYCLSLRSAQVLQHEIDSHFCPQTLDNLSTAEAPLKKNKSTNSWQCPACCHPLAIRATSTVIQSTEDPTKPATKKAYYQACTFCRWSSRGIGMPDKDIVNGAWTEKPNPNAKRVTDLLEYYKYLAQVEKVEEDIKKSSKTRGFYSATLQKYGVASKYGMPGKKATPMQISASLSALRMKDIPQIKEVKIEPAKTLSLEDIEPLSEDFYTTPVDFTKAPSVQQRHRQPQDQPSNVMEFWPQKTMMFTKQSLRCKGCDHNIIKPEYNASSIKFKIHLVAVNHVPEIRINKVDQLSPGVECRVILTFINPTQHELQVTLLPHIEEDGKKRSNAQVSLPTDNLILMKYDEAAEFISPPEGATAKEDDPRIYAYRRGNRIGFYVSCTPDGDLKVGDDVWITFSFKHEHFGNTAIVALLKGETPERKEGDWVKQTVFVNLGKIAGDG